MCLRVDIGVKGQGSVLQGDEDSESFRSHVVRQNLSGVTVALDRPRYIIEGKENAKKHTRCFS
jgi:hypothetical protein